MEKHTTRISDAHNRIIDYLRVSVTPDCNLNCSYCRPKGQVARPGKYDLLTIEQIGRLIGIYSSVGVRKVRLTGGEPLLREGVETLIRNIKMNERVQEVSLTTNGVLLKKNLEKLKKAGLDRINISLDSLKPEKVRKITGRDVSEDVLSAVTQIIAEDIWPLKLNVVVMKGVNDDEILDFAKLAAIYPLDVRFIELMPFVGNKELRERIPMSCDEIKGRILQAYDLVPVKGPVAHSGPAKTYAIKGGKGKVGFISPISEGFCENCNRVRLTAEGQIRPCLFSDHEADLRPGFENNEENEWFIERLQEALGRKQKKYDVSTLKELGNKRSMLSIGG